MAQASAGLGGADADLVAGIAASVGVLASDLAGAGADGGARVGASGDLAGAGILIGTRTGLDGVGIVTTTIITLSRITT